MADQVESVIRNRILFRPITWIWSLAQRFDERRCEVLSGYSYLIAYRPDTKPLQIVSILHGRRNVEQILKGRL